MIERSPEVSSYLRQTLRTADFFLLCLEKYEEALVQFREAGASLKIAAITEWLTGRHHDAAIEWRRSVSGIRSGTIIHFDFAGGVSDGLLLWYAAVTLKDDDLVNYALEFFHELSAPERLSSFPGLSSWPGPLVHLALGATSAEAILEQHFGNKNLGSLLYWNADMLQRSKLASALFYIAVRLRADGQEQECRRLMSAVARIENPLIAPEWYLARGEMFAIRRSSSRSFAALFRRISSVFKKPAPYTKQ